MTGNHPPSPSVNDPVNAGRSAPPLSVMRASLRGAGPSVPLARSFAAATAELGGAGASLLVAVDDGRRWLHPVCATPGPARRVEDCQELVGEGPGLLAHQQQRPVLLTRLADLDRWPGLTAELSFADRELSLIAYPLTFHGRRVGVLDLYRRGGGFTAPDLAAASKTAVEVCRLLLEAAAHVRVDTDSELETAEPWLDPHGELAAINRATGMLNVQLRIPTDQALLRMRAHAFAESRPLARVAADIVGHRLLLQP
jgi:hypothetical protein